MRFFLLLFLSLAQLLVPATAFGLYGSYERVVFYYAWLIDKELNGGTATTVATGASGNTLYSFVNYIAGEYKNVPSFTTAAGADIDTLARQLNTLGINGNYEPVRIISETNRVDGVFKAVGKFIGSNLDATQMDQNLLRSFRAAMQRVQFLRTQARSESVITQLEKAGVTVTTKDKTLTFMSGARQTYPFLDIGATTSNNPGKDVQGLLQGYDAIGGTEYKHLNNIKLITWARCTVGGCGGQIPPL